MHYLSMFFSIEPISNVRDAGEFVPQCPVTAPKSVRYFALVNATVGPPKHTLSAMQGREKEGVGGKMVSTIDMI